MIGCPTQLSSPITARLLIPLNVSDGADCLRLNVGGASFCALRSRILAFPDTRLGQLASAQTHIERLLYVDGYLSETNEFYFDRSHYTFDWILNLYRTGTLHISESRCLHSFLSDLDYWQIDRKYLAPCCQNRAVTAYAQANGHHVDPFQELAVIPASPKGGPIARRLSRRQSTIMRKQSSVSGPQNRRSTIFIDPAYYQGKWCGTSRRVVWTLLENPTSSSIAMAFSFLSLSFIVATVVLLILSSVPDFQSWDNVNNMTVIDPTLDAGDTICVGWFTFEYLLRLWSTPERLRYIKEPLSVIDVAAILPFYIELGLMVFGIESKVFGDFRRSFLLVRILRLLRVLRVLRILKVARYSTGFQSMGTTLKRSYKELILLVLFMTTANILFSTMMYYLEWEQPGSRYYSIPAASWWCIITMTTVGYGDVYPVSVAGKILAGIVSISGVILLAFPISVIVENFNQNYADKPDDEEIPEDEKSDSEPSPQQSKRRKILTKSSASMMFVPIKRRMQKRAMKSKQSY